MILDLRAAFNTIDHAGLIECLRDFAGINGIELKWFSSYLKQS